MLDHALRAEIEEWLKPRSRRQTSDLKRVESHLAAWLRTAASFAWVNKAMIPGGSSYPTRYWTCWRLQCEGFEKKNRTFDMFAIARAMESGRNSEGRSIGGTPVEDLALVWAVLDQHEPAETRFTHLYAVRAKDEMAITARKNDFDLRPDEVSDWWDDLESLLRVGRLASGRSNRGTVVGLGELHIPVPTLGQYLGQSGLWPWLKTTARNHVFTLFRETNRFKPMPPNSLGGRPSPGEILTECEALFFAQIRDAFTQVPVDHAKAFYLTRYEGWIETEAAQELEVHQGTVWRWINALPPTLQAFLNEDREELRNCLAMINEDGVPSATFGELVVRALEELLGDWIRSLRGRRNNHDGR